MVDIIYKERTFTNTSFTDLNNKKLFKVMTCPYCGIGTDGTRIDVKAFAIANGIIADVTYKCTSCDKIFHVSYKKMENEEIFVPYSVFPNFQGKEFSDEIQSVSPRFIKLYNQAYKAEYDTNYELAGCGYRNALEVLIKDYAINVLGEKKDDVKKYKLYKAIELYLKDVDMSKCADVVRILGNDNTHYERDYENIDFSILKQYLNIFIEMIEVQIKVKNPPVSRGKEKGE